MAIWDAWPKEFEDCGLPNPAYNPSRCFDPHDSGWLLMNKRGYAKWGWLCGGSWMWTGQGRWLLFQAQHADDPNFFDRTPPHEEAGLIDRLALPSPRLYDD